MRTLSQWRNLKKNHNIKFVFSKKPFSIRKCVRSDRVEMLRSAKCNKRWWVANDRQHLRDYVGLTVKYQRFDRASIPINIRMFDIPFLVERSLRLGQVAHPSSQTSQCQIPSWSVCLTEWWLIDFGKRETLDKSQIPKDIARDRYRNGIDGEMSVGVCSVKATSNEISVNESTTTCSEWSNATRIPIQFNN